MIRRLFGWCSKPVDNRQIFQYYDGEQYRFADPVVVWETFEEEAGKDWPSLLDLLRQPIPAPPSGANVSQVLEAHKEKQNAAGRVLAAAVSKGLGVPPLSPDGRGMTVTARIFLAAEFLTYMGALAAAARPFVSSPSPTVQCQDSSSTSTLSASG